MDLTHKWIIGILDVLSLFCAVMVVRVSCLSSKRQVPPTFLDIGKRNITVHKGGLAILRCKIRNLGPKQVAWRKLSMDYPLTVGKVTFDPEEDVSVDFHKRRDSVTEWNLVIKRAQPRHSGTYECQISAHRVLTHHVYLHVLDTPVRVEPMIRIKGTEFVNLYEQIKLTCNVTFANRAPELIDWFHDGHMIRASEPKWLNRIQITRYAPEVPGNSLISELIIEYSELRDDGRYVCRSWNYDLDLMVTDSFFVNVLNTDRDVIEREAPDGKGTIASGQGGSNCGYINSVTYWLLSTLLVLFLVLR